MAELINNMGVYNDIFNACAEIETLYAEPKKNPIMRFFEDRAIEKSYKTIYDQIRIIDENPVIPERLFDGYLDCLGSTRSSFGSCRKIMKVRELYVATFEFKLHSNDSGDMGAVVDVSQFINGGFGHIIATKFHIIRNTADVYQFSTNYSNIISEREDEINFSDTEHKTTELLAMEKFRDIVKEDIYLYLKEFVDNSKNRLERKRGKTK